MEIRSISNICVLFKAIDSLSSLFCSIANIVYCMRTENIESVICDGQWIMQNYKILTVDEVNLPYNEAFILLQVGLCVYLLLFRQHCSIRFSDLLFLDKWTLALLHLVFAFCNRDKS
jgi:hypothetical protein